MQMPKPTLPGGITTGDIHSLNGLGDVGMIFNRSGDYVDPLRWKEGIQGIRGIGDLETYPGSGGADPLLRNPIHPSAAYGLGATLTPGLHGLMAFPRSGGSDVLVRNPIDPSAGSAGEHAWYVGAVQLGGRNKITDSTSAAADVATLAHVLGLSGLGCGGSCGCGGTCGDHGADADAGTGTSTGSGSGMGDLDLSLTGSVLPGISASLPAVPNWMLYGALAYLLFMTSAIPGAGVTASRRRRNPTRGRARGRIRGRRQRRG